MIVEQLVHCKKNIRKLEKVLVIFQDIIHYLL